MAQIMVALNSVLDVNTLIAVNALISCLSALAFGLAYRIRPRFVPPLSLLCWCATYVAFAAGFAFLLFPTFKLWISASDRMAGNLLIDLGTAMNLVAVLLYLKRPRAEYWVLVPASLLALSEAIYVLSYSEDMRVMVSLGCVVRAMLTGAAATALLKCADDSRRQVARLAAMIHVAWAVMLVSRMLWWLFNPHADATVDPTSPLALATRLVLTSAITPCLFWMLTRQLDAELLRYASRDALTGLVNRRVMWEQGQARAAHAVRQSRTLAVLIIDIDHFKSINDRWGHPAGDAALVAVARTLSETVAKEDLVGRIGGEEFLVLPAEPLNALALAERLRAAAAALSIPLENGQVLQCTISVGHAQADAADADWQRVVTAADEALYGAKRRGRNRVVSATAQDFAEMDPAPAVLI